MVESGDISTSVPIGGGEILSMGVSMLLVVAVVIGLGCLYSRLRLNGGGRSDVIQIVASRGLGPKERLLLVQVGDQQLLLGMTSAQLSKLHSFDAPLEASAPVAETTGFADRLRAAVRGAGT